MLTKPLGVLEKKLCGLSLQDWLPYTVGLFYQGRLNISVLLIIRIKKRLVSKGSIPNFIAKKQNKKPTYDKNPIPGESEMASLFMKDNLSTHWFCFSTSNRSTPYLPCVFDFLKNGFPSDLCVFILNVYKQNVVDLFFTWYCPHYYIPLQPQNQEKSDYKDQLYYNWVQSFIHVPTEFLTPLLRTFTHLKFFGIFIGVYNYHQNLY